LLVAGKKKKTQGHEWQEKQMHAANRLERYLGANPSPQLLDNHLTRVFRREFYGRQRLEEPFSRCGEGESQPNFGKKNSQRGRSVCAETTDLSPSSLRCKHNFAEITPRNLFCNSAIFLHFGTAEEANIE
jgi:hypothetical protein